MDGFSSPSLLVPTVLTIFGSVFLVFAYKMPENSILRLLFAVIGAILVLIGGVTWLDWALYKAGQRLEEIRSARYSPAVRLAEYVSRMKHEQILVYEQASPFRSIGRLS